VLWGYGRPGATFYLSPATAVLSHVPTAVVAPIKREVVPDDSIPQPQAIPDTTVLQHSSTTLSKAHLPPFETFRAHAGSTSAIASESVTSQTPGDANSSAAAVNLCLGTRVPAAAEMKPEVSTEPAALLTSFYRHTSPSVAIPAASAAAFPFPIWHLPVQPEVVETQQARGSVDGHVTQQVFPVVQQAPPTASTVAQTLPSTTSCCDMSTAEGNICN